MVISAVELADGTTLEQFAQSVRDGLRGDWRRDASLFAINSFERTQVSGEDAYSIAYRVQESPEYCVVDVVETVVLASSLPGNPQGFRARYMLCDWLVRQFGEVRARTLDSFRVSTRQSAYYTQFVFAHGVTVKASAAVNPAALRRAAEIMTGMMLGPRNDIRSCLTKSGAAMAIIPKDEYVTSLPEFAFLKGRKDIAGNRYDSFAISGLGAVKGQPVSSTSERNLLRLPGDLHAFLDVTIHEFAHAIQNLCFTQEDRETWNALYDAAIQANVFPGKYLRTNPDEFFAILSTAYFAATSELGVARGAVRETFRSTLPDAFAFVEGIYGAPSP